MINREGRTGGRPRHWAESQFDIFMKPQFMQQSKAFQNSPSVVYLVPSVVLGDRKQAFINRNGGRMVLHTGNISSLSDSTEYQQVLRAAGIFCINLQLGSEPSLALSDLIHAVSAWYRIKQSPTC